jgi:hypothetical protein
MDDLSPVHRERDEDMIAEDLILQADDLHGSPHTSMGDEMEITEDPSPSSLIDGRLTIPPESSGPTMRPRVLTKAELKSTRKSTRIPTIRGLTKTTTTMSSSKETARVTRSKKLVPTKPPPAPKHVGQKKKSNVSPSSAELPDPRELFAGFGKRNKEEMRQFFESALQQLQASTSVRGPALQTEPPASRHEDLRRESTGIDVSGVRAPPGFEHRFPNPPSRGGVRPSRPMGPLPARAASTTTQADVHVSMPPT